MNNGGTHKNEGYYTKNTKIRLYFSMPSNHTLHYGPGTYDDVILVVSF